MSTTNPDPLDKVAFRSQSLHLALGFAAVGWLFAVAGPIIAFELARPSMGLAVVDPAGSWHFSRLTDFWSSETVYNEAAKNVCLALLSRNPSGADDSELWSVIFTEAGRKKANKLLADTTPLFRQSQIFQSVKCGKIQIIQEAERDHKRITRAIAWCQVIQNGTMNGVAFTEPFDLRVTITLVSNDDFLTNGMFPLVADDFTLERLP